MMGSRVRVTQAAPAIHVFHPVSVLRENSAGTYAAVRPTLGDETRLIRGFLSRSSTAAASSPHIGISILRRHGSVGNSGASTALSRIRSPPIWAVSPPMVDARPFCVSRVSSLRGETAPPDFVAPQVELRSSSLWPDACSPGGHQPGLPMEEPCGSLRPAGRCVTTSGNGTVSILARKGQDHSVIIL